MIAVGSRTLGLPVALLCVAFACCQPTPPAVRTPDERRASAQDSSREDTGSSAVDDSGAQDRARRSGTLERPFRIERVAALDATRAFAISDERLFRVRDGRWEALSFDGGVARDVVAARGALWLLVEGRGDNAGRALILRSTDGDHLTIAQAVRAPIASEAGAWTVRALAVRGQSLFVAGQRPSLVRVDATSSRVEYDGSIGYQSVRPLADDSIVCVRTDGDVDVLRYGTRTTVVSDGLLATLADVEAFGYVVHEDGSVWRGRPAKELRRIVNAAPFEPRVAAILRDGRVALAGAGGPFAVSRGMGWQVVPGEWPTEPVAIADTEPPLVFGRDGTVLAAEGQGRVVVRPRANPQTQSTESTNP